MRLAAQAKMGFYPAAEAAVSLAASYLQPPAGSFAMLDPCAGKGAAIGQLAGILGGSVYAIELDERRGEEAKAALPEGNVLAPASCFGVACTPSSFSFLW